MRADASAVLYEVADVSEGLYACQRQLGSAFDMNLKVKENGLKVSGKLKKFERIFDAGNYVTT